MSYTSVHNHTAAGSNTRLLDSINKVEELIQYAYDIGLDAIAITDHESVKALPESQAYLRKMRKENPGSRWETFKVIQGNEIYLTRNGLTGKTYDSKKDKFYHFLLLAKNPIGHEQIRELSTRAYSHSFMRMMLRVPTWYKDLVEIIGSNPGNVIASTACIGSQLDQMILQASKYKTKHPDIYYEAMNKIESFIDWLIGIFGKGNFFLELQPSHNEEQVYVNNELLKLGARMNIPAIISTDSHYLKLEDRPIHKAYLNSKDGDREVDDFYATTYVMTPEEIHSYMDEYIGAEAVNKCLANTRLIYDMVEDWELKRNFRLPYLPSPEDIEFARNPHYDFPAAANLNWNVWNTFLNSKEDSDKVFIKRIVDRCNKEKLWTAERIERLETELQVVWDSSVKQEMTWSKYFLQVADYEEIAWNEGDSLVAPGRGSGVGFYINYLCDIIQIDPMKEKAPMLYWRFLNPERASILDIDNDVQSNRRNKIIEALQNHYGANRVLRVSTERTEASKASILTAARGLGIDLDVAQYIASLIESDRGLQRSLKQTYYGDEELGYAPNQAFKDEMDKYPELWETAQRIEGLPCGAGIHAGGVIIVDEEFTKGNSMIKLNSGEWASAFDLHESENCGGQVKIDLLATKGLTIIRTCLDLLVDAGYIEKKATLRETYENAIGVYKIERDNVEMWEALSTQKIINAFQFDTPQGVQACSLCHPSSIEELAALNATMRLMSDGGEQPLEKFKRFKENPGDWDKEMDDYGLTEDEKKLMHYYLDYENGIAASQEDLMRMTQDPQICGWTLKKSDNLRKSIAKILAM